MNFTLETCQINATTPSSSGQIFRKSGEPGTERVGALAGRGQLQHNMGKHLVYIYQTHVEDVP